MSADTRTTSTDPTGPTGPTGPAVYPLHRCKTIHLIRHGQAFHNVAGEANRESYLSYEYFDSSLTSKGWQQANSLHNHLISSGVKDSVQLVVVSPLTRTMQTACGAFGKDYTNGETRKPLMVEGVGKASHKAISSAGAPPLVAVEWCREHLGVHPCDKRQSISTYKSLFPAVDFSDVENEEDLWWDPKKRETDEELYTRARIFVQWLLKRPEKEIAVVSHSSFLIHLMAKFGDDCSPVVKKELHSYFANCEMRSVILADRRSEKAGNDSSTDYPGGDGSKQV